VGDYIPVAARHWEDMLKKYLIERAAIEPSISILPDENWVTFTLRYVVDLKKRRSTKDRLFTGILERIARTEGRVSVGASTLEVSLKQTPQMQ
ncbi:MAG: mechanosensitive ion channel family protein, partial [Proteobacteria bacterium]|nr:mechanosensitive ion channel family protein [Pseudomonadota bacterium]